MVDQDGLFCAWGQLDDCKECRDDAYADRKAPAGASFWVPREGCVPFIGEAPPRDGGFWGAGNGDAVRPLLFPALPGWTGERDPDSIGAIEWFVQAGFFFVQAMKWPLCGGFYNRLTPPDAKRQAVQHAVTAISRRRSIRSPPGRYRDGQWRMACMPRRRALQRVPVECKPGPAVSLRFAGVRRL